MHILKIEIKISAKTQKGCGKLNEKKKTRKYGISKSRKSFRIWRKS